MQRGRLLILVALILIVISVGGIFLVLQFANPPATTPSPGPDQGGGGVSPQEPTATPNLVPVVRAAQDITWGAVINEVNAVEVKLPADSVPLDLVIRSLADVQGKVARASIPRGALIYNTMVVSDPNVSVFPFGSSAALRIPRGSVAISLPYNRADGVAYGVRDGDKVDIIVSWALVDVDLEFQSTLPNLTAAVAGEGATFAAGGDGFTAINGASLAAIVAGGGPGVNAVGRSETDPVLNVPIYLVPREGQRPRLVTQGIIQRALVVRVGEFGPEPPLVPLPTPTATPTPDPNIPTPTPSPQAAPPSPTPTPAPPDIITLAVPPQEALVLDYVKRLMERYPDAVKITYVLRSGTEDQSLLVGRSETQSVTLQYMFEQYAISLPAKLPYGLENPPGTPAAPAP